MTKNMSENEKKYQIVGVKLDAALLQQFQKVVTLLEMNHSDLASKMIRDWMEMLAEKSTPQVPSFLAMARFALQYKGKKTK